MKQTSKEVKKVEKKIRQKILVEEGGRMNSDVPYKVIYSEVILKINHFTPLQVKFIGT